MLSLTILRRQIKLQTGLLGTLKEDVVVSADGWQDQDVGALLCDFTKDPVPRRKFLANKSHSLYLNNLTQEDITIIISEERHQLRTGKFNWEIKPEVEFSLDGQTIKLALFTVGGQKEGVLLKSKSVNTASAGKKGYGNYPCHGDGDHFLTITSSSGVYCHSVPFQTGRKYSIDQPVVYKWSELAVAPPVGAGSRRSTDSIALDAATCTASHTFGLPCVLLQILL